MLVAASAGGPPRVTQLAAVYGPPFRASALLVLTWLATIGGMLQSLPLVLPGVVVPFLLQGRLPVRTSRSWLVPSVVAAGF